MFLIPIDPLFGFLNTPGAIARSVTMSLGNQEAPRSILASGTSFREDLVMKIFLRPFFLFHGFKKSICQLMAKGWSLSTGNLPRGGLPRNSVDRITDRPDMTSAVDRGSKALTQLKLKFSSSGARKWNLERSNTNHESGTGYMYQ